MSEPIWWMPASDTGLYYTHSARNSVGEPIKTLSNKPNIPITLCLLKFDRGCNLSQRSFCRLGDLIALLNDTFAHFYLFDTNGSKL